MNDDRKTKAQLLDELANLRQRIAQLEMLETERKEAQEALQESEDKFRLLVHELPDGVCIHEEGHIIFSNESHWRMLGFESEEEILGADGFDFIAPEYREMLRSCIQKQFLYDEAPRRYKMKSLRRDGSKFPGELVATKIMLGGRPVMQIILRDVSERELAENALATEKERLRVTLHSIGDGVITTDTGGNVILINRVAEELTGWPREEARGKPLGDVFQTIDERDRTPRRDPVERVMETGAVFDLHRHTVLVARDGSERMISNSGAPIRDSDNHIIGVVLVFRDVTEQRRMEADLLKASKLESLGILAGGIAHDFNNILTGVIGNISLAKIEGNADSPILDRLAEAEKAALRARDLTRRLLTFARGGAPIKQTTAIGDLLKDSASFVLSGSKSRCEFEIPPDLWPIDVDEGQISQVINNMVINADQAMPEPGTIQIHAENITVGERPVFPVAPGRYVRISIRDHGVGIPGDHLPKIFDPYFTTKQRGSGLGLATAYSIVKNHDGFVTVDSELGKGATFHIYLPASEKPAPLHKTTEAAPRSGDGRILVADDEEVVREVARQMLNRMGYEVVCVEDGAEAVETYRKAKAGGDPFDAVIMDLTIPGGMGGKEAMEGLLQIDPAVKAIVASGYSNDPVMSNFKAHGFSGVVAKPFQMADLSRTLEGIWDRRGK